MLKRKLTLPILVSAIIASILTTGFLLTTSRHSIAAPELSSSHSQPAPLFKTVTPAEARELISARKELLLIDVRGPQELTEGAIEGSTLVPLWDIVKGRKKLPKNQPILLICAVGGRSLALGQLLNKYGWPEVYNLKGGISAWKEAGFPVIYN